MNITKSPYLCSPNIMAHPDYETVMVELDLSNTDCVKAGSPINEAGQVANDASCIGILLTDCHKCVNASRGLVVIAGRIKQDIAAEWSGIPISDEAKAALVNVSFTGDGERMGGVPEGVPYAGKERVIAENQSFTMNDSGYSGFVNDPDTGTYYQIKEGQKYRVIWDGVEYDCTGFMENAVFGPYITDTNTLDKTKFYFRNQSGKEACWVQAVGDESYPATHTFSLYEVIEEARKIDSRCLPSENWVFELEDGSTVVKKVVVAE